MQGTTTHVSALTPETKKGYWSDELSMSRMESDVGMSARNLWIRSSVGGVCGAVAGASEGFNAVASDLSLQQ